MANVLRRILTSFNKLPAISYNKNVTNQLVPLISSRFYANIPTPYEIVDVQEERKAYQDVMDKVNTQVAENREGRLFAIIYVQGKQVKITEGDVFVVEGYWPPTAGDKISFDKVLALGSLEFTLIGRPLVQRDLVNIEATVIEKTLSHTKTHFRKKRRKQYMRTHFFRIPQTMVRINKIEIKGEINHPPDVRVL